MGARRHVQSTYRAVVLTVLPFSAASTTATIFFTWIRFRGHDSAAEFHYQTHVWIHSKSKENKPNKSNDDNPVDIESFVSIVTTVAQRI